MERLNVWIHCRVLAESSRNLLNYQEKILFDVAKDNNMNIVGVTKEVFHRKNFDTHGYQKMINHIKWRKVNIILVYSEKRISVYEDLVEEFMLLCELYNVRVITLKDLQFNFLFKKFQL